MIPKCFPALFHHGMSYIFFSPEYPLASPQTIILPKFFWKILYKLGEQGVHKKENEQHRKKEHKKWKHKTK